MNCLYVLQRKELDSNRNNIIKRNNPSKNKGKAKPTNPRIHYPNSTQESNQMLT
uniref:Uncharacterized protein n=1 Tax=Rhizophora mucronata TaxID=61149 RepID=A0A2P2NXL8_RHIMU